VRTTLTLDDDVAAEAFTERFTREARAIAVPAPMS